MGRPTQNSTSGVTTLLGVPRRLRIADWLAHRARRLALRARRIASVAGMAVVVGLSGACSAGIGVQGTAIGAPTTTAPPTTRPTVTLPRPTTTSPSSSVPLPSSPSRPSAIAWQQCGRFQCGTLTVPLDYTKPDGDKITLALRKLAVPNAKGTLFTNPGGPGGSGYDFVGQAADLLAANTRLQYDIVGWDPRGVARSNPVQCLNGPDMDAFVALDGTPDDDGEVDELIEGSRQFAHACQTNSAQLLPHLGTPNVARDLDRLREAVGDQKLNYIGFSYGTLIGARYAELFPDKVGRLVLDGAVHPTAGYLDLAIGQGKGFDNALDAFMKDCQAKGTACGWQPGGDLRQAFKMLDARIDANPLPVGSRKLGPGEFFNGVADPLYARESWPQLAAALQAASQGNGRPLLDLSDEFVRRRADGSYGNDQAANASVNCLDRPATKDVGLVKAKAGEARRDGSLLGHAIVWSTLSCGEWPVPPTSTTDPLKAEGVPPVLVVGTSNDPATPYVWAEEMHRQLPGSMLLSRNGEGHIAFFYSACVQTKVAEYLVNGNLPPSGSIC